MDYEGKRWKQALSNQDSIAWTLDQAGKEWFLDRIVVLGAREPVIVLWRRLYAEHPTPDTRKDPAENER